METKSLISKLHSLMRGFAGCGMAGNRYLAGFQFKVMNLVIAVILEGYEARSCCRVS